MKTFTVQDLNKLYKPLQDSSGGDNGEVTIIGGSTLFHGAPLLALTAASKFVDMVYFASPEPTLEHVAQELKSRLFSFIWVPWNEVEEYIKKSNSVLIGSGMMRYKSEEDARQYQGKHNDQAKWDEAGEETRKITEHFLKMFPDKRWVIDAGALQTMDASWIPENAIITPNRHEMRMLFEIENLDLEIEKITKVIQEKAYEYKCVIVLKGPITYVSDGKEVVEIKGGNPGLTKGGTGDVQAGLTTALLAKNDPMLSACAASYLVKQTAEELEKRMGYNFNADELALDIYETSF